MVAGTLARLMADVLHMDHQDLDHDRRLDEYGLDSLMLAELLHSLRKRFDIGIPPLELLRSGGTITDVSHLVLLRLGITAGTEPSSPPSDARGRRKAVQPVLLDEQSWRRLRRERSSATLWCP